jgi:hypothetical protein
MFGKTEIPASNFYGCTTGFSAASHPIHRGSKCNSAAACCGVAGGGASNVHVAGGLVTVVGTDFRLKSLHSAAH